MVALNPSGSFVFPGLSFPGYGSGRVYGPTIRGTTTTASAIVADKLYFVPFWVRASYSFSAVRIEQTGAGTTGNVRLGVYAVGSSGYPSALQQDCGTVACPASTGTRTVTTTIALTPGRFWLAAVFDAAVNVNVMQTSTGTASGPINVYQDFLDLGTTYVTDLGADMGRWPRSAHAYAALPNPAPSFEAGGTNIAPVIALVG